eukprot:5913604-Amphidinium_carterae.1
MDGQPTPMQPQTANFPNSTGPRRDCGHAQGLQHPPGFSPRPSASAAAASPVPNLNFSHLSRTG